MQISAITSAIEARFPLSYQESWDNSGLQVGSLRNDTDGVLLCVDCTEDTVNEAIDKGCKLIVSHHPLIFRGFKRLTGDTLQQRVAETAVRHGISVYSCHTPVDNVLDGGVSGEMARMLGFTPVKVLSSARDKWSKVTLHGAPCLELTTAAEEFVAEASGCLRPRLIIGDSRMEVTLPSAMVSRFLGRVADVCDGNLPDLEISKLENTSSGLGLGAYALCDEGVTVSGLVRRVKDSFGSKAVRTTSLPDNETKIRRLALCGGSGSEFIPDAIASGAQAFITSDTKYHDFLDYGHDILIIDIGHFEAEKVTKEIFYKIISKKFPTFAVWKSEAEQNCINYL